MLPSYTDVETESHSMEDTMKAIVVACVLCLSGVFSAEAAIVDVYGASGSFGTLGATLPTGQSVTQDAIAGWQFDGGQAAFFPAVTSDGTVFISNLPQTTNELNPTACDMAVTCFNATTATCFDSSTGTAKNFSTIRVPTIGGSTFIPSGGCATLQGSCAAGTCTTGNVGAACGGDIDCEVRSSGADVSDVEVVGTGASERLLFDSTQGSETSGSNAFPQFGALLKSSGAWRLDTASTRTPLQFQQSNLPTVGPQACPNQAVSCCTNSDCGTGGTCTNVPPNCASSLQKGTCNIPCTNNSQCGSGRTCVGGQCGTPSCRGFNEMVHLPISGKVVLTEYFGGIVVVDTAGKVWAAYQPPAVADPCNTGTNLTVALREVDADPTSITNDERFVVDYDVFTAAGGASVYQPAQEFSYNDSTHTITAVSAAVRPTTAANPAPICGQSPQGQVTQYDHAGNLWMVRDTGLNGGPIDIFLKDSATAMRNLQSAACNSTNPWGTTCAADLETGLANITPSTQNWNIPWAQHILEDANTGAMFVMTTFGQVVPIERSSTINGSPFTVRDQLVLGKDLLRQPPAAVCSGGSRNGSSCVTNGNADCLPSPADPSGGVCLSAGILGTKGTIDAPNRWLWEPIYTSENSGPTNCNFFTCKYQVGRVRDAWLYRLNIDQTLGFGARTSSISAPSTVTPGMSFTISITANFTQAELYNPSSFLAVYINDSATLATPRIAWTASNCVGASCMFTASVPASATSGQTGNVIWHAFLANGGSPLKSLHTVGRAQLTAPACQ